MNGYQLEFFMEQHKRHQHHALWEWLLNTAKAIGIRGATAFVGTMGFGQHGRLHSAHFFELGDQPVEVTMVVTKEEADKLFDMLRQEKVHMFYAKIPVEFGVIGEPEKS